MHFSIHKQSDVVIMLTTTHALPMVVSTADPCIHPVTFIFDIYDNFAETVACTIHNEL